MIKIKSGLRFIYKITKNKIDNVKIDSLNEK
ncbi:MAG: hypothetical protein PWP52_1958 [Bacteroidales bacterium]|nr:hypothetical protein [Bacteroidales bacterium]